MDVTRQYLQNLADYHYLVLLRGYKIGSIEKVKYHAKMFLGIILDMEDILATNENFLLGKWFDSIRKMDVQHEENIVLLGACKQVTTWGPNGEINNYAMKQWTGLMEKYVHKRWKLFFDELIKALEKGVNFDEKAIRKWIFDEIEKPFCQHISNEKLNLTATGDTVTIAQAIFMKYSKIPRISDVSLDYIKIA